MKQKIDKMVKREKPPKNPDREEKPSKQHDIELYEIKVKVSKRFGIISNAEQMHQLKHIRQEVDNLQTMSVDLFDPARKPNTANNLH